MKARYTPVARCRICEFASVDKGTPGNQFMNYESRDDNRGSFGSTPLSSSGRCDLARRHKFADVPVGDFI